MSPAVTPVLHVPDVLATVAWYTSIGFTARDVGYHGGLPVFAALTFGDCEVMLSSGGHTSRSRRDADLYIRHDGIGELYRQFRDRVDVVEEPHDTFYGMREFIIRDINGFWITFGQPAVR